MELALPLLMLVTLANKIVDFAKFLRNKDWNGVGTQLAVWVAGIIVVVLGAASDFDILIPGIGRHLGQLNFASQLLLGFSFGSLGSQIYDFKKAFDNSDNAITPALIAPMGKKPTRRRAVVDKAPAG